MDLNKIRERLDSFNKQSKPSGSKRIWKPQPGSQVVRIVPYIHERDWPFLELYFYYDFGKRTIIAPQNFGEPDPVQELADKLKSTGEKEDWQLARKIEPKMRTYVPVIVRGKESEGVKFWGFGKTIYTELLSIISDPDYGDITDLINGRDIDVEFTPAEGGAYPKTAIRVKPNTQPATEDKEIAQKIMNQPEITDLFPEPSYEELEKALAEWMNPENADSDVEETQEHAPAAAPKTTAPAANKVDDVASAFNDLFN